MLIGNKSIDTKMYRGIEHFDGVPLISADIHEFSDTLYRKSAYLSNNLYGSGIINRPELLSSTEGVSLQSPFVLLLDGDISLIRTESNVNILKVSDIQSSSIYDGVLCAVAWYQRLDSSSALRKYGGVDNTELSNDLSDKDLGFAVSYRYQLRWDTVLVDRTSFYSSEDITISIKNRDAKGTLLEGHTTLNCNSKIGDIRVADIPVSSNIATYASSKSPIYVIPLIQYTYNNGVVSPAVVKPIKGAGALDLVKSSTIPTRYLDEGLIWYDTENLSFNMYIDGVGFVPMSPERGLKKYQSSITLSQSYSNTDVSITIPTELNYASGDILSITYGGATLSEGEHYTISSNMKTITLLGFTTQENYELIITVTSIEKEESTSAGSLILF